MTGGSTGRLAVSDAVCDASPVREPGDLTLTYVGDLLVSRPVSQLADRDAGFRAAVEVLRNADAAFGNLETTFLDLATTTGEPLGWEDEFPVHSEPRVADDLHALGFRLLGRANNHAMDWARGSLLESDTILAAAGVAHAGTGTSAQAARRPAYVDLAGGRVGLVSVTTSPSSPIASALDPAGGAPGRAGVNEIATRRVVTVPERTFRELQSVLEVVPELDTSWIPPRTGSAPRLEIGHVAFERGASLDERFELDERSVLGNMSSVRLASQHADVCVFAIHAHQGDRRPERPRPFLREVAHAAIDAGATVVAISGSHTMAPVERYEKGVVFYGLGNFFWHVMSEPLQPYLWRDLAARLAERFDDPSIVTQADLDRWLSEGWEEPAFFDAAIARTATVGSTLTRVEVVPIRLSPGPALRDLGIPRRATGDDALRILEHLAEISASLGTKVTIDGTSDPGGPVGVVAG